MFYFKSLIESWKMKKKEKNDEASSVYSNSIKFKKSGRKVNEWLYNRTCHITG